MTLDEYLNQTYHKTAAKQNETFGKVIGCERQSVERIRKFQRLPGLDTAYRIYRVTRGEVEPFDLLSRAQKLKAMALEV
jgi:hypothetical protein